MASHWPFQFGYFALSAACTLPIVTNSAVATTTPEIRLQQSMFSLPASLNNLIAIGALVHAFHKIHRLMQG